MGGEFREDQSVSQAATVATVKHPHISANVAREVLKAEENNLFSARSILLGISKNENGKYVVCFPGLKDSKTGNYVGVSFYETSNILEAKSFFLRQSEELESIQGRNIINFTAGDVKVAFSNGVNFFPRAAVRETPIEYSDDVANLLHSESPDTFINTVNTEGWQNKLFSFVNNYVQSNEMIQKLMLEEKIRDLRYLSPKQAVSLVTAMVIDLTKYHNDWGNPESPADKSTVMKLLGEGNVHKNDPEWQGNGVCRNFASITKALFDAIKSNQRRYNLLENTYCAIRSGMRQDYNPGSIAEKDIFLDGNGGGGHAWNDFIQVSSDGLSSNVTTVDVTWAQRDLDTKDIVGLDHTLKRMEKSVQIMAKKIPDSKEGLIELKKVLSYYDLMIRNSRESESGRHYYAKSVLSILNGRNAGQFDNETRELLNSVAWVYINDQAKVVERNEIEGLYKLAPDNDKYVNTIVEKYLTRNKSRLLFDNRTSQLIFSDSRLQGRINQKLHEMGKFDEVMKGNRNFREHMEKQNSV